MSLIDRITTSWAHSKKARQVWIETKLTEPDPAPTYSRLDRMDGLGR